MEHRWGRRHTMDVPVRFVALPATIGTGRVINMSVTGAYMETTVPLRKMSVLFLEPSIVPGANGRVRRIAASVVRHDERGVGLEWCDSGVERSPGFARLTALASAVQADTTAVASDIRPMEDGDEHEDEMAGSSDASSTSSGGTWGYQFEFVD
jgi:hypothetical protein